MRSKLTRVSSTMPTPYPRLDKKTFCYETCDSNLFMRINRAAGEPIFIHNSFTEQFAFLTNFFRNSNFFFAHYLHSRIWNSNRESSGAARFGEVQEYLVRLFRTRKKSILKFPSPWLGHRQLKVYFSAKLIPRCTIESNFHARLSYEWMNEQTDEVSVRWKRQ